VLEALKVAPERVREQVVRRAGSDEAGMGDRRPLTPRATRRVLEVALEEALRLGHDHGDLGQSFWGRVGEPEGVAAQVLYRLGVDPDGIQREVALVLCTRETGVGGAGRAVDLPLSPDVPSAGGGARDSSAPRSCGRGPRPGSGPESRPRLPYEVGKGNHLCGAVD
jgi:Clp amino terminal domain, pathogenicity island component